MRRRLALSIVAAALAATPVAFAQEEHPQVDVVEVVGVIDRPLARYIAERLDQAEREQLDLVVLHLDSAGAAKISTGTVPDLVRRISESRVPVAVQVGPRGARAAGGALFLLQSAHVASMGPSARIGPPCPVDVARPCGEAERRALAALAGARGRSLPPTPVTRANASLQAGAVDLVVPSVAELLLRLDGRTVTTTAGAVTLRLPKDEVSVRLHQPGPVRRFLHTLANPILVYLLLMGGAMLVVFELSQPGFGVAGVTGGLFLLGAVYGLTVLPGQALGLAALVVGLLLLTVDVVLDRLALATVLGTAAVTYGSLRFLPRGTGVELPMWLGIAGAASAAVFFVPVMTVVRRARTPISTEVKRHLIGESGQVRSILNPEGFVTVDGEVWRARSDDGKRRRVGEDVVVTGVDGTVLLVADPAFHQEIPDL